MTRLRSSMEEHATRRGCGFKSRRALQSNRGVPEVEDGPILEIGGFINLCGFESRHRDNLFT